MIKKSLIFFGFLFLISFVSAASFDFSELLESIDESFIVLGSIFILSFIFVNFALSKFFKQSDGTPNKPVAGIAAFVISLLITWGINKWGIDYDSIIDILSNIGLPTEILMIALPLILIVGIIYVIIRFGVLAFLIIGILLLATSFTNLFYNDMIIFWIGIIIIGISLIVYYVKAKRLRRRIELGYS